MDQFRSIYTVATSKEIYAWINNFYKQKARWIKKEAFIFKKLKEL